MRASYRLNLCGCEHGVGMTFRNSTPYPKTPGARQKLGKSLAAGILYLQDSDIQTTLAQSRCTAI